MLSTRVAVNFFVAVLVLSVFFAVPARAHADAAPTQKCTAANIHQEVNGYVCTPQKTWEKRKATKPDPVITAELLAQFYKAQAQSAQAQDSLKTAQENLRQAILAMQSVCASGGPAWRLQASPRSGDPECAAAAAPPSASGKK